VGRRPLRLLHDGTFSGFLAAVAWATTSGVEVEGIEPEREASSSLFDETRPVPPDPEAARSIWNRIVDLCGADVSAVARAAFLSESPGIGTHLWHHLRRILSGEDPSRGRDILELHSLSVLRAAERTRHEAHRMLGFLRFSEAPDGSLFAVFAPDHDVLSLVAPHFRARLPGERWIIADARRGTCVEHAGGCLRWGRIDPARLPRDAAGASRLAAPGEEVWTGLWRSFHRAVSVRERRNTRQQDRLLPRKYRRYLPERPATSAT
jgi:probable DNA metabolism protein